MERRKPRTKEEIDAAFEKNPPNWNLSTFEGCCEYLRFLRDESSDEVPEEIIHSYNDLYSSKVRKNWWRGLMSAFQVMEIKAILPSIYQDDVKIFVTKYSEKWFWTHDHRTTKEHIEEANSLITRIAGE